MVTESRSTSTPQVSFVAPTLSHVMENDRSPSDSMSASTNQKSTKPSRMATMDMKAPCTGRNRRNGKIRKKAEALRAGMTHAQLAPMVSARGI